MLLEDADYFVRMIPFPHTRQNAAVMPNDDGTYSVYIDSNSTWESQRAAMDHELAHLEDDDLYSATPVAEIERRPQVEKGENPVEKCDNACETPVEKCVTPEKAAETWASSWEKAMLWAETMRSLYGDSDCVPLYQP